jgi:hypothetical protein
MNIPEHKFPIGLKFIPRGKNRIICTIYDVEFKYSVSQKEFVSHPIYKTTHKCIGQTVYGEHVGASISLGYVVLEDGTEVKGCDWVPEN